jgi:hypothetical protein
MNGLKKSLETLSKDFNGSVFLGIQGNHLYCANNFFISAVTELENNYL